MWNINDASDEQRETMVTALKAEQKAYADAGQKERATAVQKSIDLWSKPTKAQRAKAAEEATSEQQKAAAEDQAAEQAKVDALEEAKAKARA